MVYFIWYILFGIFCPVYFVRYILSGMFCPGSFCLVYVVCYVLSWYILSSIFCRVYFARVYFVRVSFVLAPYRNQFRGISVKSSNTFTNAYTSWSFYLNSIVFNSHKHFILFSAYSIVKASIIHILYHQNLSRKCNFKQRFELGSVTVTRLTLTVSKKVN